MPEGYKADLGQVRDAVRLLFQGGGIGFWEGSVSHRAFIGSLHILYRSLFLFLWITAIILNEKELRIPVASAIPGACFREIKK